MTESNRTSNPLLERAERMRQYCLAFANLHPESKTRCGDALGGTRTAPTIAVQLADLVDDLVLALQICEKRHIRRPTDETRGVPPREFELESHQGLYTERAAAETSE